jgi:hypothetical protein
MSNSCKRFQRLRGRRGAATGAFLALLMSGAVAPADQSADPAMSVRSILGKALVQIDETGQHVVVLVDAFDKPTGSTAGLADYVFMLKMLEPVGPSANRTIGRALVEFWQNGLRLTSLGDRTRTSFLVKGNQVPNLSEGSFQTTTINVRSMVAHWGTCANTYNLDAFNINELNLSEVFPTPDVFQQNPPTPPPGGGNCSSACSISCRTAGGTPSTCQGSASVGGCCKCSCQNGTALCNCS